MDKSFSDPNLNCSDQNDDANTTQYFVSQRTKKRRGSPLTPRLDEISSFKEEIKQTITALLSTQEAELKKITTVIMELKESNSSIEKSMEFLAAQNNEFQKKIENLEGQSKKDREYIVLLEDKVEDLQREHRKTNIEIKNIPKNNTKESKEDLINMVLCLSNNIGCKISKTDIKDIYRIQRKKDDKLNTPVIVETSSTLLKTDILTHSKSFNIRNKEKLCAKHLGLTKNADNPVYVSEQLTAKAARLYFLARDLSKSKSFKFCWTAYGRVYVRKDEQSPIIAIKSESQVHSLLQKI